MQDTLLYRIKNGLDLSENEKDSLYELLATGCRQKRRYSLSRRIYTFGISTLPHYGILGRVSFINGKAQYFAGQSYLDELKTVREIISTGR